MQTPVTFGSAPPVGLVGPLEYPGNSRSEQDAAGARPHWWRFGRYVAAIEGFELYSPELEVTATLLAFCSSCR